MKVQDDFPLDPTAIDSGVPVNIVASRTFILIVLNGLVLLQNDAQLKNHAWLYTTSKFRRTDGLGIFGMYHFICTSLHVVISVSILAIAFDDIIKSLTDINIYYRMEAKTEKKCTFQVEQNIAGTGIFCPR
jgi:hypothetical protein